MQISFEIAKYANEIETHWRTYLVLNKVYQILNTTDILIIYYWQNHLLDLKLYCTWMWEILFFLLLWVYCTWIQEIKCTFFFILLWGYFIQEINCRFLFFCSQCIVLNLRSLLQTVCFCCFLLWLYCVYEIDCRFCCTLLESIDPSIVYFC